MFMKRRFRWSKMLLTAVTSLAAMTARARDGHGQTEVKPPERLSFEVASIKAHKGVITFSMDPAIHGRRVAGTASTLLDLIVVAYGVRYNQISDAPRWADTDHYDVDAKADDGDRPLAMSECRQRLQALLADRFHLQVHRETQEMPVYALVVGKNGSKLKAVAADATGGGQVRAETAAFTL